MKIGDLVRPKYESCKTASGEFWIGLVCYFVADDPVVFWDLDFSEEVEYKNQLVVISEVSGKNNCVNLK